MISFVNFARIASICVGFDLGRLHGYFFHKDFWPNLNFPLEYQIKLALSFNRGERVIAAFLDVEKAFDSVWHNGLRYKIHQLDLPTKLCRWLSDFLVGRVIQVKIEGFLSPNVYPKAGVPQD